jgi:probable HAF family extracellular repeat protein
MGLVTDPNAPNTTTAYGINDSGQIVGYYLDAKAGYHSFLDTNGVFTEISDPNAPYTLALGIDNNGQVVGQYQTAAGAEYGFWPHPTRPPRRSPSRDL